MEIRVSKGWVIDRAGAYFDIVGQEHREFLGFPKVNLNQNPKQLCISPMVLLSFMIIQDRFSLGFCLEKLEVATLIILEPHTLLFSLCFISQLDLFAY